MTKEEKNEKYRKNQEKHIKSRKSKITALIVVPIIGVAITLLLNFLGENRQNEIASATVLGSRPVSDFLSQEKSGAAIFTGSVKAVDPVSSKDESGEYISFHRKTEQEMKIYNEEKDKYDTETKTISDERNNCSEIEIGDITVPYKAFHNLPSYSEDYSDGAANNLFKTSFTYTPSHVEGTFFLKCENGKVSSAQFYESVDVAGESKKGFGTARILIWVIIVVIEIFLIYGVINTTKIIKNIEEKISEDVN